MAGPWFTVRKSGDDFERLGQVWLSDGTRDDVGWLEYRVWLEPPEDTPGPSAPGEEGTWSTSSEHP